MGHLKPARAFTRGLSVIQIEVITVPLGLTVWTHAKKCENFEILGSVTDLGAL